MLVFYEPENNRNGTAQVYFLVCFNILFLMVPGQGIGHSGGPGLFTDTRPSITRTIKTR